MSIDNPYFEGMVSQIYPAELQLHLSLNLQKRRGGGEELLKTRKKTLHNIRFSLSVLPLNNDPKQRQKIKWDPMHVLCFLTVLFSL